MVSHLTNNETYFFREQPQLNVFAKDVLRAVKDRKARSGERTLGVLSVGCSTGEEPLTLAMILFDSGQFFWGWDVKVTGLDVDEAALEKARRGLYHQNSLRAVTRPAPRAPLRPRRRRACARATRCARRSPSAPATCSSPRATRGCRRSTRSSAATCSSTSRTRRCSAR